LFQTVRYTPKDFSQRQPDGNGHWTWNLKNVRLVLYRLPDVISAHSILICEGEKDVETAYRLGLPSGWAATCNPMGAGKWRPEYSEYLTGKMAVICPDADEAGQRHSAQVAQALTGVVAEVRLLTLPFMDLSEWVEQGGAAQEFHALLANSPDFRSSVTSKNTDPTEKLLHKPEEVSANANQEKFILVSADKIRPQQTDWAWAGRIPLGGVTILAGDPGLGKSTITIDLAARWSRGQVDGDLKGHPINVVIATAEDSLAHTVVPRLRAAGADLSRIHFVQINQEGVSGGLTLPGDLDVLARKLQEVQAGALIIDPLMAHLSLKVNSWQDQSIRQCLAPLAALAEKMDLAMPVIMHLNKSEKAEAQYRVGGSIGIVAAARSVLLTAKDPENEGQSLLAHLKCNLALEAVTQRYRIEGATVDYEKELIKTSRIVWLGEAAHVKASDILIAPDQASQSDRQDAQDWLRQELQEGPRMSEDLFKTAVRQGITKSTLKRAKQGLGVIAKKEGFGKGSYWIWKLPIEDQDPTEGNQYRENDPLSRIQIKKDNFNNDLLKGDHPIENDPLSKTGDPLNKVIDDQESLKGDQHLESDPLNVNARNNLSFNVDLPKGDQHSNIEPLSQVAEPLWQAKKDVVNLDT